MKLTMNEWLFGAGRWTGPGLALGLCLMGMVLGRVANAQAVTTTTVQGTVYLANGQAGAGTLDVSWPAFTTANNQAIAAGRATVTIAPDGFMTVNLAPNQGATPAGLYYTAIYHMSDGTTSTEYWVVPAAAQASLGQVRAQLMPAAQAVQAVSKAYVDQSIAELTGSLLTASGGTLSGPLYLNGDPTQPLQAADKHYVDTTFNMEVPIAGGSMTGPLTTPAVNGVQSPVAGSPQTTLQAAIGAAGTNGAMAIPPTYAGSDGFTNPSGVRVIDLRPGSAQQTERSVKEFGAVCDGATDDTNALQAALNFAQTHGVALTIPEGTCKTHSLNWHGESIGGMGKQVSALMGFPGQDVLATVADSPSLLAYTRIHDLTIYVDQSVDASCSPAEGRVPAGSCALGRLLENNSIFSPGGSGLTGTVGTDTGWAVGNCAIAMPAATGLGGNGLRVAEMENLEIAATGVDPLAAQYPGAHSKHTCGLYLAQWPQWSEFRNIDIRGVNTGIAIPALPVAAPAGLNADSNRWQNITIQATHGFTAAAGSNNVLDNVVAMAGNSAATAEPPTGLVLDFAGAQQGWTVRNAVVLPAWNAVQPQLALTASGGAVTGVTAGLEHGLGFDPYGTQVPLKFSGSCTAQATASVNSDGSIGTISVTQGGTGCLGTTTASVNAAGNWDTSAPVNLIDGQSMSFFGGNLLKGNGGYTVWNATGSQSYETQLDGGGGTLRGGGSYTGLVANSQLGTANPVDQFPGADFGAKLQACLGTLSASYGGMCDARNFTGTQSMGSNLTISTANATVLLPCATISTANQVIVTAGTRNVSLRGCALRGASTASGSQGGTVFLYSGTGAMVQVGDPTYAADTMGFHLDNVVVNTTAANNATAQGLMAYRTQEMDLESLYFLGNQNQTGMTLDGTGNYTGGTFFDNAFNGFQTAVNAIGHQISNPATTDWLNASTFVRLHIDCPTSGGSQIAGTYGINLQQGDGNTFTGGDVEGCSTALHLGPNAQNNTIVGLRNENSTNQVVADAGSAYNNWMTGGTMFTGALTDNGTRNSFLDTFHRSFNGIKGDWYGSQKDATVTNHWRLGTGAGNERGLLNEIQTDYGYRWIEGYSDATAGEQFYQIDDLLNNVYRLSIGQYNNGQSSTNNQTVINAAGTGAIVLNGSNNSGTGGVIFGSGGASETSVATINNAGNAQFNGTLLVGGTSQSTGTMTVRNNSDAEVDYYLWPGLTASQKGSYTYKDWNGNSQWYMVKDASNNWALNSATGGLDSFKAYQSTNSGDTYIDASNSSGVVRVNYETGSGTGFNIYGGNSSTLYASFTGTTAIKFPGLAASSGHNCVQVDSSGYLTNTGSACGTGSGGGSGTVNSGNVGQIAYYAASGTAVGGMNTVPVTAGGTGASTAAGALVNLGGVPLSGAGATGAWGISITGNSATATNVAYSGLTGTVPIWNQSTTGNAATATTASNVPYSGLTGTVSTWNQNTTGNAATATALAGTPTLCSTGYAPMGILPSGNATGCTAVILLNPSGNQTIAQPSGTGLTVTGLDAGAPNNLLGVNSSWSLPLHLNPNNHVAQQVYATAFQGGNEYDVPWIPGLNPSYYPIYGTTALQLNTQSYTTSDTVVSNQTTNCNSPGDCNAGIVIVTSSNGAVNGSEEGAHGGDLHVIQMAEPSGVISSTGGESGNPSYVTVNFTSNSGNQGDGKLLVDTQAGKLVNGARLSPGVSGATTGSATPYSVPPSDYSFPQASDTSWSLTPSTIVQLCYAGSNNGGGTCASGSQPTGVISAQTNNSQPAGPVTVNVVASYAGIPSGYCNSGNLQSSSSGGSCYMPASGVGCLADFNVYETVGYTYSQSAQTITFSPKYPHINGMSFATGGACGEAVEATVDGQWFPIVGSLNSTTVLYAEAEWSQNNGLPAQALGISIAGAYSPGSSFVTSGQLCETDGTLSSFSVSGNTITAAASSAAHVGGNSWGAFNGLTMTISTPNSTYNGNWPITVGATTPNAFNLIQYTVSSTPSGTTPTTGTITYCNLSDEMAPAVMAATVYNPSTHQVDGYIGLEPNNSPFSNGDAVMQVSYPWVHFSEHAASEVTVHTPEVPVGSGPGSGMTNHNYYGLISGSYGAETFNNTTPLGSYAGFGGTHIAPRAVISDYGAWASKWEMQYPPAPQLAGTAGSIIKVDSAWPSPIGSGNRTLSNFNIYTGPSGSDQLVDEMPTVGRWDLPAAIMLGAYDPAPTVLYMKSAGVVGVSKDANTSSYASDGELDAGILSAATVNATSASVSSLTGYVYANGSSAETASTTIPGSAISGNIPGNATGLSGTPTLPTGTTLAANPATSDNSTKVQTTAGSLAQIAANTVNPNTPAWLQYLGNGADGSNLNASGNLRGDYYYTNFTVPYGNTVTVNSYQGLTIHATGICTIAGKITAVGEGLFSQTALGGSCGGTSGGGAAAGYAANASYPYMAGFGNLSAICTGGSGGSASGGNGNNATSNSTQAIREFLSTGGGMDGGNIYGSSGQPGGSTGGAAGAGGGGVTLICSSVVGTDGTHTGVIDISALYGNPPSANSTGAGSGGGGGVAILSSQQTVSTWPIVYAAGGPGGLVTVPYATWTSGSCTSPPKATLAVSGGALSGSCTVVQAGAGCGTGAGTTLQVLGSGGTLGTGTVTPTWSGGTLASCSITSGTSSGYTAATYTTAGTGGDGGPGWYAEFSGW